MYLRILTCIDMKTKFAVSTNAKLRVPQRLSRYKASAITTFLFLFCLPLSSVAQTTLAAWDFFGISSPATATATAASASLAATPILTRGPNAAASSGGNSFRTVGFLNNGISTANTDYFQTTLTASAGNQASLSTIDARFAGTASFAASPGTTNQFAYSLDGTNFTLIGSPQILIGTPALLTQISLSGISALQNVPSGTTIYIRYYASGQTTTGGWGFASAATLGTLGFALGGTVTPAGASPTITGGTVSAVPFTTTYGSASAEQTFTIGGTNLTSDIIATAPTGFEVSSDGTTFAGTATFAQTAGTASGTLSVRISGTAPPIGNYNGQNVVLTSSSATQNITTSATGNTVTPKNLTVTGTTTQSKPYDGTTAATVTGGALVGIVNSDVVALASAANFASVMAGTGIAVSAGYSLTGTHSNRYTITQPTGLMADITPLAATVSGIAVDAKLADGSTIATLQFGAATLNGILSADATNVTLNTSAYIANFAQSTAGTGIAVAVTGLALSGSASGNYLLSQPLGLTGSITSAATPVITSALSLSATYGTALSAIYTITASNSPTSFSAIDLPTGLVLNTTNGEISGTPLVQGSYTVTLNATNGGGIGSNAFLVITIAPKPITIDNAVAQNKLYDGTAAAVVTADPLSGLVAGDAVGYAISASFVDANVGAAKMVSASLTLTGADAAKYSLSNTSASLTADITIAPQVISFTLTSPLSISTSTVALSGTSTSGLPVTYNSSNTTVATIAGNVLTLLAPGTTTITASQVGNSNYDPASAVLQPLTVVGLPAFTEVVFPQYMQGVNGTNANRLPYVYRATLSNLLPIATYRYTIGFDNLAPGTAPTTGNPVGIALFTPTTAAGSFTQVNSQSLSTAGAYGTFTTDADGTYTGWFAANASANAVFTPGSNVRAKIVLNNGTTGTTASIALASNQTITVLNLTTASNGATALQGSNPSLAPKNIVFMYDDLLGTARPITGAIVEDDGGAAASYATFYTSSVNGVANTFGTLIPNALPSGIRRIEQRDFTTGTFIPCASLDADGNWPSGANTVNAGGGTTAITLAGTDLTFATVCGPTSANLSGTTDLCYNDTANLQVDIIGGTQPYTITISDGLSTLTVLGTTSTVFVPVSPVLTSTYNILSVIDAAGDVCPSVAGTAIVTVLPLGQSTETISICAALLPYSWNGQTLASAGTYYAAFVAPSGCDSTVTLMLSVSTSGCTAVSTVDSSTGCHGQSDKSWTVDAVLGTGATSVTYVINPALGTEFLPGSFVNLPAGTYTITATDNLGGTATVSVTLVDPALLQATASATAATCFNGTNAVVSSSVIGGTPYVGQPYTYITDCYTSTYTYVDNTPAVAVPASTESYVFVIEDNNGCRDTSNVVGIVNPAPITSALTVDVCNTNLPYSFNGVDYTTAGPHSIVLVAASNGCDSTVALTLNIKMASVNSNILLDSCGQVSLPNGVVKFVSGQVTVAYTNTVGCDSIMVYDITVRQQTTPIIITLDSCGQVTAPNGTAYTSSTSYTNTFTNLEGCDSAITFNIVVRQPSITTPVTLDSCGQVTLPNGVVYTSSTATALTYTNSVGCDSIMNYTIIVRAASAPTAASVAGLGSATLPNGSVVATSGTYTITYTNNAGCDSVVVYTVTITSGALVSVKVALSGAYQVGTSSMSDSLRVKNFLPTIEPYNAAPYSAIFTHVNGGGGEATTSGVFGTTGANAIVDWVFLELRSSADPAVVLATRSALLQVDGDVVDVDGTSPVLFSTVNAANYFVAVRHRNHAGAMTALPIALNGSSTTLVNFMSTTATLYSRAAPQNNASPLTGAMRSVGTTRALYAGNCGIANAARAKIITYNTTSVSDRAALLIAAPGLSSINGYSVFDCDLNGVARFNGLLPDRLVILLNCANNNSVIIYEQLP
jgi:hypothetical protein